MDYLSATTLSEHKMNKYEKPSKVHQEYITPSNNDIKQWRQARVSVAASVL